MARRSQTGEPEALRASLVQLLTNFRLELQSPDLRRKVLALVPAFHLLRDLGSSLIPAEAASSARDRILCYLRAYPRTLIQGEELMVVAGIGEWARRVRELRVEFGWAIATGVTMKEAQAADAEEGITDALSDLGITSLKTDHYILLDEEQDRDAAIRWNIANEIRKSRGSIRDKILRFFRENVGHSLTSEELRYVSGDKSEWARRVRELRTELGWPILTKNTGRPDLKIGVYILESDRQLPEHDRVIPDPVRIKVLERDNFSCVVCGWNRSMWNQDDPRNNLELHHRVQHAHGGENTVENLETLCNVHHDEVHRR